jgi:hypothetical protein
MQADHMQCNLILEAECPALSKMKEKNNNNNYSICHLIITHISSVKVANDKP